MMILLFMEIYLEIKGGITINCQYDHRIAMSFLVLGAVAENPIKVVGCKSIYILSKFYFRIKYYWNKD